jgi:1-deoxy-D-xylulose-5-phosphate reductoisomerase
LKRIAILGSTGSIGTQSLEVIQEHNQAFEVEVITANNNSNLLIQQAIQYKPNAVVIGNKEKYKEVQEALSSYPIKVYAGMDAIEQIVEMSTIDVVLTAIVGFAGLSSTLKAIEAGKQIALANKETLVVAGELVKSLAKEKGVNIYPVDSEHSAIFQCIVGEKHNKIEKIYLTASGGPFRGKTEDEIERVTKAEALIHPCWNMGQKITIDSASMMNKGLEVIEAKWLFDVNPSQIEIIVHPQSIIHSLVQFEDGSIKAQLGLPNMKLPIQYALSYPYRLKSSLVRFDFMKYPNLTFEPVNTKIFRNISLAYEALNKQGNAPCIMNAANEVVVEAFLQDRIKFIEMSDIIEKCMYKATYINHPSLEDYIQSDIESRQITHEYILNHKS